MESQRETGTVADERVDERTEDSDETAGGPDVSVHRTSKGRVVFTESENNDGWIATDLAVEPYP